MDVLAPLIVIVLLGVVVWLVSGPLRTGAGAADEAEGARRDFAADLFREGGAVDQAGSHR